jgi:hypothetical protein
MHAFHHNQGHFSLGLPICQKFLRSPGPALPNATMQVSGICEISMTYPAVTRVKKIGAKTLFSCDKRCAGRVVATLKTRRRVSLSPNTSQRVQVDQDLANELNPPPKLGVLLWADPVVGAGGAWRGACQ